MVMGDQNVLEAVNVVKEFSGVRVLDNVNFTLRRGEVHALLGENGAGKSTLMKILAGVYAKTKGQLLVNGKQVEFKNRHDAARHGIGIVFQELSMVPKLTVEENLYLGKEIKKKFGPIRYLDKKKMRAQAEEAVRRFEIDLPMNQPVKELGVAKQQLLEICKALFDHAKILILDEPTAALAAKEIEALFNVIRELKKQGVSFIYISHRLGEIKKICDRATIIRDGKNIKTVDVEKCPIEQIVSFMTGKDLKSIYPPKNENFAEELLRLEGFSSPRKFHDIDLSVRAGEILGITGLVGAGKTEIAHAIFGLDRNTTGNMYFKGRKVSYKSTCEARIAGIAMIPEDRKNHGVILKHSALENIALPNLHLYRTKMKTLDLKKSRRDIAQCMNQLDIRPPDIKKKLQYFSGGNQQKVVIAKWLQTGAKLFIFDEPTRGVDIGAKMEIYKLIAKLAASGCGIIVCSSETEEVVGLSNKIMILKDGGIVACMDDTVDNMDVILKTQLGG